MKKHTTHVLPRALAMAMIAGASLMPTSYVWAQPAATYTPVQQDLDYDIRYFFPEVLHAAGQATRVSHKFRADIPQPKDILGFEVGEQYVDWNDVLKYMVEHGNHVKHINIHSDHSVGVPKMEAYIKEHFPDVELTFNPL